MDENMNIEGNILRDYRELKIMMVEIPEGVAAISDNAFSDFPNLQSVQLPKSLVMIGDGVFRNCPKLKSVDLTGVRSVGAEAFSGCTSLQSVTFGKTVSYLPNALFLGCTSLAEITLPDNISYIGCECFKDCTSLTNIEFKGVMEIDNNAFENCSSLFSVTLPASLTHISSNAFSFCRELSSVIFRNRFTDIDETAFVFNVGVILKAVMDSSARNFAAENGCKFKPVIIDEEYRLITGEQLALLSGSGIMMYAKKVDDKIVIHFDRSSKEKINKLIGGETECQTTDMMTET